MADFSKNITNAVNVFGNGPSSKWGQSVGFPYTFTWGLSPWGEGGSLPVSFIKVISNSQPITWDYAGASLQKIVEIGSAVATSDMGSEYLRDGTGLWNYVFTSNEVDAENRNISSWNALDRPDATFTCQAVAGTSWSEV